jgi:UDP-galactopyranose mutase
MAKKKLLVLGAGFAGATVAHLLKEKFDVTVLEADAQAGGGCRTQWYGGHPYTFGPRIFFTKDDEVVKVMKSLLTIRHFDTISMTYIDKDSEFYNYPIQWSDLPKMPDHDRIKAQIDALKDKKPVADDFEGYWISAIGETLYEKFVNHYSKKMWGVESNRQLTANWEWVNRGIPIRDGDVRLYQDQFQGYPEAADGYNGFFDKALAGTTYLPLTRVRRFEFGKRIVHTDKGEFTGDIIVNTLPIDYMFDLTYGKLQYCGRTFMKFVLPVEYAMPEHVTWVHYASQEPYTRITEFKKITGHKSPHTLLGLEIPDNKSRYYPVQSPAELLRLGQYTQMFPKDFYSIGRHGSFKYKGIPDAIRDALDVAKAVS